MLYSIATAYLCIKFTFFYSLVRIQVKAEPMKKHYIFLGVLYTCGVAFLSYIFLASWQKMTWAPWQTRIADAAGVSPWLAWILQTLVLSVLYFKLLGTFDEGCLFWILIVGGLLLVWF